MTRKITRTSFLIAAALAVGALAAAPAVAHDYKAGAIVIDHPWSRATPGGAKTAAGYFKLTNTGATPDRLVAATAEVSPHVDIHEASMVDGMMQMRPLKDGVALAPGQTVEFKPGAFHLMMMDINRPLHQGDRVKGTLTFEKAGKIDVEFAVEPIGGSPQGGGTMQMDHMQMH